MSFKIAPHTPCCQGTVAYMFAYVALRKRNEPSFNPEPQGELDVNSIVSYRIRTMRERRGWTQDFFADRLAAYTGKKLPQASISLMERGFESNKRRRFDAHELYILSRVFEVPILYFFMPPKGQLRKDLLQSTRPASELYAAIIGIESELPPVDDALDEIGIENPEDLSTTITAIFGDDGPRTPFNPKHFRRWRADRINRIAHQFEDRMNEVRDTFAEVAKQLDGVGVQAWFASNAWKEGDDDQVMHNLTRPIEPDDT